MKPLIKPDEAIERLGVSEDKFNILVSIGEIPIVKIAPKCHRVNPEVLDEVDLEASKEKVEEQVKIKSKPKPKIGAVYFIGTLKKVHRETLFGEDKWYRVVKIGFTTKLKNRLRKLNTASPHELYLLAILEDKTMEIESNLHSLYHDRRLNGEWFYFDGNRNDGLFRKIDNHSVRGRKTYKRLMRKYS